MRQLYAYVAKESTLSFCVFFPVRIAFVSMLNATYLDAQEKPILTLTGRTES